jgi:hypothetical protein
VNLGVKVKVVHRHRVHLHRLRVDHYNFNLGTGAQDIHWCFSVEGEYKVNAPRIRRKGQFEVSLPNEVIQDDVFDFVIRGARGARGVRVAEFDFDTIRSLSENHFHRLFAAECFRVDGETFHD